MLRRTFTALMGTTILSLALAMPAQAEITAPVTAEEVAALGDVTLRVWADAGEEAVLAELVPRYEAAYPNVTVELTIKGWGDLMGTVVNAMNSNTPPDVTQGNYGFAIMTPMVRAGLLRPLDDFISAYGIDEGLPPTGFAAMRWNEDGTLWGEGPLYGMGAATQPRGLFFNKAKLEALGLEPPQNIEELEAALAAASEAGELPIMLGNAEQYPLGSHLLGILINLYSTAEDVNGWIAGREGSTFDMPGVRSALQDLQEWGEAGYFGQGYDGKSLNDAITEFSQGNGVFFLGGSFNGARIAATDPEGFGFTLLKSQSGEYVTTGTFGTPWQVSAKTQIEPAALAFLGMMLSPELAQVYADANRLPNVDLVNVTPTGTMHAETLAAAQQLFNGGVFVGTLDWATPTMQRTLGTEAQLLLAGRTDVDGVIEAVQADWDAYQLERQEQ